MNPRPYRRLRGFHRLRALRGHVTGIVIASLLAGGALSSPAAAQAPRASFDDLPPQEPGVTLRVFDVQAPLSEICDLKPGQTPNVDRLMPTIDWSSDADFGVGDHFVSQVSGNITVPQDGAYAFRLTSDDGSRLLIDGKPVIDHDGLHGAEPKDGTVELTAGITRCVSTTSTARRPADHPGLEAARRRRLRPRPELRAEHRCRRRPGHRPRPQGVRGRYRHPRRRPPADLGHPTTPSPISARGLRAADHRDGLAAGRAARRDDLGRQGPHGRARSTSSTTSRATPARRRSRPRRSPSGLKEPMGIKYVDGKLYVSQKHELTELSDTEGDDAAGRDPQRSPTGRSAATSMSSPSDCSTGTGTSI